jgi:hypothetical protein
MEKTFPLRLVQLFLESVLGAPLAGKSFFVQFTHHLTPHLFKKISKKNCMLGKHRINSPLTDISHHPLQLPVPPTPRCHRHPLSIASGEQKKKAVIGGKRSNNFSGVKKKNPDNEFSDDPKPISSNFSTKLNLKNQL